MEFLGTSKSFAFFEQDGHIAVVDMESNALVEVSASGLLASLELNLEQTDLPEEAQSIAQNALATVLAAASGSDRMYTIPGGVQAEAKKALEWRREHRRGGTPVGINTARTLAKGGQIGIKKIRHIAKYFPRHEVDKKGKGWKPGTSAFPSNGRIAWALWGGDAAWRWAEAIVERENKKALAASGYEMSNPLLERKYDAEVSPFKLAHELDLNAGPEFMARVRLDGTGIDRLYKIDIDGRVCVWDDCAWDDLGHVDGDVYTYDKALDDPYDKCEKDYVVIDASSAVIVSAFLQERPFTPVLIEEIDPEEAQIVHGGLSEEDYTMLDRVLTAAGEAPVKPTKNENDGEYTPEERAKNVQAQPRDASGLFVKVGSKTIVGGDPVRGQGTITAINVDSGTVSVRLDNGRTIDVDPKHTKAAGPNLKSGQQLVPNNEQRPLDLSGIIGEPRTPHDQPKAHLPGTMKPLTDKEIALMISDFPEYVKRMRASYKPRNAADKARVQKDWGKDVGSDFSIIAAAESEEVLTPKTTDVPAKYLAIVSPDDKSAVMDLVAIVPKTVTTTEPMLYERKDGQWVPNEQILLDLKSATPPPVVQLKEKAVINDVLVQVDDLPAVTASAPSLDFSAFWDAVVEPLLSAGGLDRNRGNAESLRRYWTSGKGAAKIRWGTPGDWTRCVRQLSKYMGVRAKGYCQLRHKEATGVYTGSRLNPGENSSSYSTMFASEEEFTDKIIAKSALNARALDAREKIGLVAAAPRPAAGAKFRIPLLIPEDLESGDGRKFEKDAITVRELPLPLLWQIKTGEGHSGSVVVGRIDYVERTEFGMGNAYGVFDTGVYGQEAERLVRNGFLRGVSADLDQFEAKEEKQKKSNSTELEEANEIGKDKLTVNRARVMAATIVAKPAFQECTIAIDESGDQEEEMTPNDGIYEESVDFSTVEPITASGFLAGAIPVTPPNEWFENPKLTKPTPMTIDPSGRIYGHIAAWHVNHIGMPRSTRPPRSRSKYAYFHTGVVRTDAGKDIPVGQLTLAGGHASLQATAAQAAKHYDDTASAIADVHAGEDEYGIWVAGSLRPEATEQQVRALRASAPSGDWRPINGSLELVAVCQVNVPGFPIARALVASGKVMALVAAGASFLAIMKSDAVNHFAAKAQELGQLAATAPDLKSRVKAKKADARKYAITAAAAKAEELRERALVASAVAEMAKFSEEERKDLAEQGMALPDGSYPIRNEDDLKNAIRAYGRSNPSDRAKVRAHIRKRARVLKLVELVPEEWKSAASMEAASNVDKMRAAITAALANSSEADPKASSYPEELAASGAVTEFAEVAEEEISEEDLKKLRDAKEEADKQTEEEIQRAEDIADGKTTVVDKYDDEGRAKYTSGVNQPRDAKGKYRKVLARLKQDLGVAGLSRALQKVEDAENLDFAGDYAASAAASDELLGMIDRLDSKALNPEALENVKGTAAELGKVISNLPLPFGKDAQKIRFSDLPAGLKTLIESMITRVEAKIGKEDADIATKNLRSYMSGADVYSQSEVQSEMSKLLRLLT